MNIIKSFKAVKKAIEVKVYDPLLTNVDDEGKRLFIEEVEETICKGGNVIHSYSTSTFYIGTLENKRFKFHPNTHLIIQDIKGERYAITREIFKETYDIVPENSIYVNGKEGCGETTIKDDGGLRSFNDIKKEMIRAINSLSFDNIRDDHKRR